MDTIAYIDAIEESLLSSYCNNCSGYFILFYSFVPIYYDHDVREIRKTKPVELRKSLTK